MISCSSFVNTAHQLNGNRFVGLSIHGERSRQSKSDKDNTKVSLHLVLNLPTTFILIEEGVAT